ncbi:ParA family protein [Burkholderia gladioli]|uniref:ParA family protein n=1 Tax=Burkholderia gladioli TaxID=28095 RepID=UPI002855E0F2|nr:ParA family protein [Burkholderia gladioli]MDR8093129.1 ParA family protein [Burkholderia gladioli]
MKTLVVATHKGGVGKTTTVVNLAQYFAERGQKVVVIDLDPQEHSSFALQAHASGVTADQLFAPVSADQLPAVPVAGEDGAAPIVLISAAPELADLEKHLSDDEAGENLSASIAALAEKGFDVCLMDTSPWLGTMMATALYVSDYVLSPFEPELFSILGIAKMQDIISRIGSVNPRLQNLGLVPTRVDRRNPRHVKHLDDLTAEHPGLVLPTAIGLRTSIPEAIHEGVPVWKMRKTTARTAAREIRALADYIFEKMELQA